jgi:hypothetical protein
MQMSSILTQVRDLTVRPKKNRVEVNVEMTRGQPADPPVAGCFCKNFIRATSQLTAGTNPLVPVFFPL